MSRTKFAAWFRENYPDIPENVEDRLHEAKSEHQRLAALTAQAESALRAAEAHSYIKKTALKAWVARRLR